MHRELIIRLARREIETRFHGSVLGWCWPVLTPLLLLTVYTFVFTVVIDMRKNMGGGTTVSFALNLFAGLMILHLFVDCVVRAPSLLRENACYIRKVIFPIEILPWVRLLVALFNAAISAVLLVVFISIVHGPPPLSALLLPVVVLPLCLMLLGFIWFLSAIGAILRDIQNFIAALIPLLIFLSPVFYGLDAVPLPWRYLFYLNPLAAPIEMVRQVLFQGAAPNWLLWAALVAAAWIVAWAGFAFFTKHRSDFADVV